MQEVCAHLVWIFLPICLPRKIWDFLPISFLIITSSVWCLSYLLLLRVVFNYIDWPQSKYLYSVLAIYKRKRKFSLTSNFSTFYCFLFGHLFFIFFDQDYILNFGMLHRCSQYYLHIVAYAIICEKIHIYKRKSVKIMLINYNIKQLNITSSFKYLSTF